MLYSITFGLALYSSIVLIYSIICDAELKLLNKPDIGRTIITTICVTLWGIYHYMSN